MARDPVVGPVTRYDQHGFPVAPAPAAIISSPRGTGIPVTVVILAGGKGTRMHEDDDPNKEAEPIPKPLVEIGGIPILEHIMRLYAGQGRRDFVVAAGYLSEQIEQWAKGNQERLAKFANTVQIVQTGVDTGTGGRVKRLIDEGYVSDQFHITYGDGLADINIAALEAAHNTYMGYKDWPVVTLTAIHPPARFGMLKMGSSGKVKAFGEKFQAEAEWANGGFMVMNSAIRELIPGDNASLEFDVLPVLARQSRLCAYQHPGWFQMMDVRRDRESLIKLWRLGAAPWVRLSDKDGLP